MHALIELSQAKETNARLEIEFPDSTGFSKLFAKPFAPKGPLTRAFATFGVVAVVVVEPETRLTTLPAFNVPAIPASSASGQPSPSESRSKLFGMPSPSISFEQPTPLPISCPPDKGLERYCVRSIVVPSANEPA